MIKRALFAIGNSVFWVFFIAMIIFRSFGLKDMCEITLCFMLFGTSLEISSLFIKFDIEPDDFEDEV